ncbi:MAG TPA: hypothetical protein VGK79_04525 [Gaiellaceae bacterium]|jgi:hypothetical protein
MLKTLFAIAGLTLVGAPSALPAAGGCHAVSGTYVNHNITCTVPAIACVQSQLTGDFAGSSTSIVTSFDPATQSYTAVVTNTLDDGAEFTGALSGQITDGLGHSVETIIDGTREFAHATGTIFVADTTARGVGTYTGEFCLGDGDEPDVT